MERLSDDSLHTRIMGAAWSPSPARTSALSPRTPGSHLRRDQSLLKATSRKLPWTTLHSFNAQLCVTQSSSSSQHHLPSLMPELKYEQRLSGHGYAILSRVQPKLFQLSETTVLGSTGCWCDILTFCKVGVSSPLTVGSKLIISNSGC